MAEWRPSTLSIVVPVFNEGMNVTPLVDAVKRAVRPLGLPFELIVVDDGSSDGTWAALRACAAETPELVAVRLARNFGQTLALQAGLDRSRGDAVVTMDGDLQNDPADIGRLLEALTDADVVSGWRRQRHDGWLRRLPSRIANGLVGWLTGVAIHDHGCALKAYRGELVRSLGLYAEMHRFIATLVVPLGARIAEVEVHHRPRAAGESHYGLSRTFRVLVDLLSVQMLTHFRDRPMRWFAGFGLPSLLLAALATAAALRAGEEAVVVWSAVSFVALGTFGSCLLLGLLGEAILELEHGGKARPVIHHEREAA